MVLSTYDIRHLKEYKILSLVMGIVHNLEPFPCQQVSLKLTDEN